MIAVVVAVVAVVAVVVVVVVAGDLESWVATLESNYTPRNGDTAHYSDNFDSQTNGDSDCYDDAWTVVVVVVGCNDLHLFVNCGILDIHRHCHHDAHYCPCCDTIHADSDIVVVVAAVVLVPALRPLDQALATLGFARRSHH